MGNQIAAKVVEREMAAKAQTRLMTGKAAVPVQVGETSACTEDIVRTIAETANNVEHAVTLLKARGLKEGDQFTVGMAKVPDGLPGAQVLVNKIKINVRLDDLPELVIFGPPRYLKHSAVQPAPVAASAVG
ncbi:MAG: hypothetical protein WCF94_02060 [bacterium]